MRDLIITENITIDGVIDASDNWFGPAGTGDADQSDMTAAIAEQREAADAFLTGRVTFETMRRYWPKQVGDDETGVAEYLNRVPKYVVSSTLDDPDWEPTTVLRGPLDEEIAALKAAPGKDIVVTPPAWSTSTACSSTPSSSAAARGCSETARASPVSSSPRPGRSARASCCCATASPERRAIPPPPTTNGVRRRPRSRPTAPRPAASSRGRAGWRS
jgi:dihydrofolate reductase